MEHMFTEKQTVLILFALLVIPFLSFSFLIVTVYHEGFKGESFRMPPKPLEVALLVEGGIIAIGDMTGYGLKIRNGFGR